MKGKRLCVLGSNSGRNAGDAAILASIVDNFLAVDPDLHFDVPTTHSRYIKETFPGTNVHPVSIMPWTGSVRLLGPTTLWSIFRSDAVLITDGIIFDIKLFNPLFNFLILLAFLVPFARLFGKKVISFCVGVGPLDTRAGRFLAKMVCNLSDAVMVREQSSLDLLTEIGVKPELIEIYADVAFINSPASEERALEILADHGVSSEEECIGVNVNSYIDLWLRRSESLDRERFTTEMAGALDRSIEELKVRVVFIITQVMDIKIADEIRGRMKHGEKAPVISNRRYSNREVMAVMGRTSLFVGMRLHSLILASAMDAPVLGLAYAPKVRHFMKMLGAEDLIFELDSITAESLSSAMSGAWGRRKEIKEQIRPSLEKSKRKAREAFTVFKERFL